MWLRTHTPHPMYNPPKGGVPHRVISTMAREFTGIREQKWNSKRVLIFTVCVLRKSPGAVDKWQLRCSRARHCRRMKGVGVGSSRGTIDEDLVAHASTTPWSLTVSFVSPSASQRIAMAVESCCHKTPAPRQDSR